MLDELARFNKERWEALAAAEFFYTRPWLDLDPISARQRVDSQNRLGELAGQKVLCLGCGGGQQSAALALLGAQVTPHRQPTGRRPPGSCALRAERAY